MKIIINSQVLLQALEVVKKAIDKNAAVPIIENFLFDVRNQVLTVSATDLINTIKVSWRIDCQAQTVFKAVVPAEILKYLKKLDGPITLSYDPETYSIELLDEGRAKYSGENHEDFPMHPATDIQLLDCTSDLFKEFRDLLNYVTGDELRPAMTGIGFHQRAGNFEMSATDGHRLKVVTVPELQTDSEETIQHFILPAKVAKILSELKFGTAKKPETQSVIICAGYRERENDKELANISFLFQYQCFDMEVITRVIDERYPQYWQVIPEKSTTQYLADKSKLNSVIDKALLFANRTTHQVRLSLNGCNKISAEDLDFSNEYCAEVGGSYTGEPIEIGFNGEFLKEVINSFGDEFTLEMNAPNKAAVIREGNTLALVMPVMLNEYV